MKHFVIGTCGHVDHGKTTLIKILTDQDTDSLKEEKERKISIDLGFAHFKYRDIEVGIIDAPGHERFIKNTLSGIFGTNLTLLLIAANEGLKPQTLEHALMLKLLERKNVIIVISKSDLASIEQIESLKIEINETFKEYGFCDHKIVLFNDKDEDTITQFKEDIYDFLVNLEEVDSSDHKVRINIDRVFSKTGMGTIVTGSLISGVVKLGQTLEHLPSNKKVVVKNIQVHSKNVDQASAFLRVALNLSHIDRDTIQRGDILSNEDVMSMSKTLDVQFLYDEHQTKPFKHLTNVFIHLGTQHFSAKVKLLDKRSVLPGETAFAQLLLEDYIYAVKNEIGIVRSMSKDATLGSVRIVFVQGTPTKRKNTEYQDFLSSQTQVNIRQNILNLLEQSPHFVSQDTLIAKMSTLADVKSYLDDMHANKEIIMLNSAYMAPVSYHKLCDDVIRHLQIHMQAHPLSQGISKLILKNDLGLSELANNMYNHLLEMMVQDQVIKTKDTNVQLFEQQQTLTKIEQQHKNFILNQYKKHKLIPQPVESLRAIASDPVVFDTIHQYLIDTQELIYIQFFYMSKQAFTICLNRLQKYLLEHDEITVSTAKDLLETTRKYIVPFLEYLDSQKITIRRENVRCLTSRYRESLTKEA